MCRRFNSAPRQIGIEIGIRIMLTNKKKYDSLINRSPLRYSGILTILFAVSISFFACGKTENNSQKVIARVDDKTLTTNEMKIIDPNGTLTADEIRTIVNNWIEQELLIKIAEEKGITRGTKLQWQIEEAKAEVIINELGKQIRVRSNSETEARRLIEGELEKMKKRSRIEAAPWLVK